MCAREIRSSAPRPTGATLAALKKMQEHEGTRVMPTRVRRVRRVNGPRFAADGKHDWWR